MDIFFLFYNNKKRASTKFQFKQEYNRFIRVFTSNILPELSSVLHYLEMIIGLKA